MCDQAIKDSGELHMHNEHPGAIANLGRMNASSEHLAGMSALKLFARNGGWHRNPPVDRRADSRHFRDRKSAWPVGVTASPLHMRASTICLSSKRDLSSSESW